MVDVRIGTAGTVSVDVSKFSAEVREAIFAYGLKQMLCDARSQFKDPAEAMAQVHKKLDALYAGTVRVRTEREHDPVAAEAKRIAKRLLDKAIGKGERPQDYADRLGAIAKRPDVLKQAKAIAGLELAL